MQFGSLAKTLNVLSVVAALSSTLSNQPSMAQFRDPRAGYEDSSRAGAQPSGAVQALFMSSGRQMFGARQTPYIDANGNPVVVPAGYFQQCPGGCPGGYAEPMPCGPGPYGGGHGGPTSYGGFTGPYPMGAGGTAPPVGYDLMEDVGIEGFLVDQRGPHYWDFRGEAVYLDRDETFGPDITFSRTGSGPDVDAPGVEFLRSSQLDYDPEFGFRVMGRYAICPLAVFEFSYMAVIDYESSAFLTRDENDLFSLFSRPAPGTGDFGVNPPGVDVTGGPMPQSERARNHSIFIDSQLQTAEMTYRRYWVGFMPRISGTYLAGFRYTRLKEDFLFHADAPFRFNPLTEASDPASTFDYLVRADNHLAGLQIGGDFWIGLMQGVRVGAEGPQTVTVRGRRTAVVVSAEDYDRLSAQGEARKPKKSLAEFLLQPDPLWDDEFVEEVNRRNKSTARDIDW